MKLIKPSLTNNPNMKTATIAMVVSALLLASISAISLASATQPTPVSGTWKLISATSISETNNGGITTRTYTPGSSWQYSGDVDGVLAVEEMTIIFNSSTGDGTSHAKFTFTGKVLNSDPGQAECAATAKNRGMGTPQQTADWEVTCTRGTGGLTGLHLHFEPITRPGLIRTYSGEAHFDP